MYEYISFIWLIQCVYMRVLDDDSAVILEFALTKTPSSENSDCALGRVWKDAGDVKLSLSEWYGIPGSPIPRFWVL